jgi:hypothetical protein
MVPTRAEVFGFAATVYPMVPLPLPVVAVVIVSHDAPLVALQLQPEVAAIEKVPVAASAPTDTLNGDTA